LAPYGFGKNGGLLIEPFYQNLGLPASRRDKRGRCGGEFRGAAESSNAADGERMGYTRQFEGIKAATMNEQWIFGLTMTIVGMGGTLVSLWLLSVLIGLLKKVFPYHKEHAHPKR
jgi:hypothetical protein